MKNDVSGIEKSTTNRSKNEAKMGIALGIDFSLIFFDFRRRVGAKLDQKSTKKRSQKISKNDGKTKEISIFLVQELPVKTLKNPSEKTKVLGAHGTGVTRDPMSPP